MEYKRRNCIWEVKLGVIKLYLLKSISKSNVYLVIPCRWNSDVPSRPSKGNRNTISRTSVITCQSSLASGLVLLLVNYRRKPLFSVPQI
jgi:hypothetical protein